MNPMPAAGVWENGVFRFPIRVYYEDTDLGGMVYHGRYVSFFERVRSESIRGSAADVGALAGVPVAMGGPLTYVVSRIEIRYHRQALLGDVLIGHTTVKRVRGAAVEIGQWIDRDGARVAEADLLVAVVGPDGRPRRWPKAVEECWRRWGAGGDGEVISSPSLLPSVATGASTGA